MIAIQTKMRDDLIEAEKLKQQLSLSLLQQQVNPHFLYNTLDNICALAELDEKETLIQLVMNLSSFYRSSLSNGKMHISIGQELEISRAYLEILQIRYFHKFDFTITCPEALKNYSCIKLLLQPILENSIYHGIKGLDRHGILHIEAEDTGDCIRFTISDNGRGFSKEDYEKIWQEDADHFGIKSIQQRILLYYGPGYGLSMQSPQTGGCITQTGGIAMSLKLLIADDEYFIRQRIKKIIPWEKLNLIFAGEAENGQQVIDHLEKEPVDLLLLDIKMPHMNGIETARYIKEHFPSVHILILSGYNDFEYARTAIRYGVKEYLLKPVAAEELERALSECIQAIHSEEQTRHTLKHYEHFHLCSMLANIRDGVLSYSDLCVQHPEFKNLAYSIYCSVYVSEHTHDAVLQLVDRLRRQDFLCEYMQESEYIYMLQIFLSDKEKLLHIGSCFTDFIAQQNEYTFLYIENIFPVTTDWKPYYTRCLHLLTERYFSRESNLCISYSHPERPGFS